MYIVFNMGLPVEERSNEHVIKRTYDKSGQIATLTSSLGADLTYECNENGEIEVMKFLKAGKLVSCRL